MDTERLLDLVDEVELIAANDGGQMGWIYFIGCQETGHCKIGFTKGDPYKRLANLQTGCPSALAFLLRQPGTKATESALHERFAASRVRGEWFEITDELRAYMIVALWAMSEVTLKSGRKLEGWMSIGLEMSLTRLGCISESLAAILEADPA